MVKLFVGNLADGVDSHRLRNLFLQHVHVQECDVLKNFAFVHVVTEEDAETVIAQLDKHRLEGREIHIERSTSRLRKEPGMGDKCFTCGAFDHKTPYCPLETAKRNDNGTADSSGASTTIVLGQKRSDDSDVNGSPAKKARFLSAYLGGASDAPTASSSSMKFAPALAASCKVGGGDETDPELPCPQNPELKTLYDQYIESRTRYFFYRERLGHEINALIEGGNFLAAGGTTAAAPIHLGTIDLTKLPTASTVTPAVPTATAPRTSTSQPPYATSYTTTGSQPHPQALTGSYCIPQAPAVSYGISQTPAASYANQQPQPIPGQHIYVVPAHSQPQSQPQIVAYNPPHSQPPQQIITVQQHPPQHSQPTVIYQHQQPPTNAQPPPTVYAPPPSNQIVISDKMASQHYSTYNAAPPTAAPVGTATITRVDLTQSASGHGHGHGGPGSQEPQFRIKINAPGVGTPPPRQSLPSNNNHNTNHNNNRPNNNNYNNNRSTMDNNPLLANLAAATVAALRAAPQLAAAAAAVSRSGPTPLAQTGLGPRPLLPRPGGGAPSPGGGRFGRFPPLMGRRN